MNNRAYKVDHDVPAPLRATKYPFNKLNIGDSFFAPFDEVFTPDKRYRVAAAAYAAGKVQGKMFVTRTVDNGVRVWRVE